MVRIICKNQHPFPIHVNHIVKSVLALKFLEFIHSPLQFNKARYLQELAFFADRLLS